MRTAAYGSRNSPRVVVVVRARRVRPASPRSRRVRDRRTSRTSLRRCRPARSRSCSPRGCTRAPAPSRRSSARRPDACGAGRPEKRVTARSAPPQKKCTGLALPMKPARNAASRGASARARARTGAPRRRRTTRCVVVLGERDGVRRPRRVGRGSYVHAELVERGHRRRVEARDRSRLERDASTRRRRWSAGRGRGRRSRTRSRDRRRRRASSDVVSPRADTYSVTCHQWLTIGVEREADLADDLRPQVQRVACVLPRDTSGRARSLVHQCAPSCVGIAVEGASRSRIRRSAGHASISASGGMCRAGTAAPARRRRCRRAARSPAGIRIRSIGERTHSPANPTATFTRSGTRGSLRSRRARCDTSR